MSEDVMRTINAFVTNHPVPVYFGLTFAISWGGILMLAGARRLYVVAGLSAFLAMLANVEDLVQR